LARIQLQLDTGFELAVADAVYRWDGRAAGQRPRVDQPQRPVLGLSQVEVAMVQVEVAG